MSEQDPSGIVTLESRHSVDETIAKVRALLVAKGAREFALIDHSGEAERVGLAMPPTRLLIFGNPTVGTPLMVSALSSAIDLPLKLLVREDAAGKVWISWNEPGYLLARHGLDEAYAGVLGAAGAIGRAAAE